jgi:hypothetical protein
MAKAIPESVKNQKEQFAFQKIREALKGIKHGTVTVIIQDGIVVQIDRTEKSRIDYTEVHRDGGGI